MAECNLLNLQLAKVLVELVASSLLECQTKIKIKLVELMDSNNNLKLELFTLLMELRMVKVSSLMLVIQVNKLLELEV